MKQAKSHLGKHGRGVCGDCLRTIKIRHDSEHVVCLAHLNFVSTKHEADCEEFKSQDTEGQTALIIKAAPEADQKP